MPRVLDTRDFREITENACEHLWKDLFERDDWMPEGVSLEEWTKKVREPILQRMKEKGYDPAKPEDRCKALKFNEHLEWGCSLVTSDNEINPEKCAVGLHGKVDIEFVKKDRPMIGSVHYHPEQPQIIAESIDEKTGKRIRAPLHKVPFASDEDVPEILQEMLAPDRERFRLQCIAADTNTACYDMKDYRKEHWTQAIENICRGEYAGFCKMPMIGDKLALPLLFEDLVKQGVVKKWFVRTGTKLKIE